MNEGDTIIEGTMGNNFPVLVKTTNQDFQEA